MKARQGSHGDGEKEPPSSSGRLIILSWYTVIVIICLYSIPQVVIVTVVTGVCRQHAQLEEKCLFSWKVNRMFSTILY